MMRVALVRGRYLNNFEGQNYLFDKKKFSVTAISSLKSINKDYPFPVVKLLSIADFQNFKILNQPVKYISNRLIGDSQILFGLERLASQFDIFHTADSHYYYSYQLAKLRQQNKIKCLISTAWETIPFNNETVAKKKFIKKFTQNRIDLFITYTEKAKRCLMLEGVNQKKIKVIRLGVNLKQFISQKHKSKVKSLNILFIGRPVWEKGLNDLQKAIKKINNPLIDLKIIPFGTVDYREMSRIYQQADIFVLPSKTTKTWEEQYGMVLVEAMASGLPIIAYNSGVIAEVIGNAGILIKENDIDGLTQSIKKLNEDINLRFKLGKMGRRRAEKFFNAQKTALTLQNIYENIGDNTYRQ